MAHSMYSTTCTHDGGSSKPYDLAHESCAITTQRQAARIEPLGILADGPGGLLAGWDKVEVLRLVRFKVLQEVFRNVVE